mgnify:CR=1 FL=1
MGHDHTHDHAPSHSKAFAVSLVLNTGFVVVEAVYGLIAGSMALVADAAHNLGDVLGLALAWGATRLARIEPSNRRTYGWRKSTILAALLNALLIMVAVGGVAWEAVQRLGSPTEINGWTVTTVASIGVAINTVSAALFFAGRKRDANIRGAFLHLAADAAVSVGVVLAGVLVLATGWHWVDPAMSLVISIVIIVGTWSLLRDSINMLMDAVPTHLDLAEVQGCLEDTDGVVEAHDLHIWAMSTSETALTAHLRLDKGADGGKVLSSVRETILSRFDISHSTIQTEPHGLEAPCAQAAESQV